MKKIIVAVFFAAVFTGCTKPPAVNEIKPTAEIITSPDLAYLLMHNQLLSEGPQPDAPIDGGKYWYKLYGFTRQGSCVDGCPLSTLYVVTSNYTDYPDGHITLCRIDGLRFYSQARVTSFDPKALRGNILSFQVRSNPEPRYWQLYEVNVAPNSCTMHFISEHRDGT